MSRFLNYDPKKQFSRRFQYRLQVIFLLLILFFLYQFIISSSISPKKTLSQKQQLPAFVITLSGHDQRVPFVIDLFKKYANIDLHPFYGINGNIVYNETELRNQTPGEFGLRKTMKTFFEMTLEKNYKEILVFEDDAIPHMNFTVLFEQLPNRCREADVLLLGATMWHKSKKSWPSGPCFDADRATRGAFAIFIKQIAVIPIIKWLEKDSNLPYDHIYAHLQQQRLIVRVAYPPFLVIPDVSHSSLVNNHRNNIQFNIQKRALIHDWQLKDYPVTAIPV